MKKFPLILILSLLGFCFTDDDKCTTKFENALQSYCQNSDVDSSCIYDPKYSDICISKTNNDCSTGDGDSNICYNIFHKDFPTSKCYYTSNDECDYTSTACSDFDTAIQASTELEQRSFCESFKTSVSGQTCLLNNNLKCTSNYETCSGITDQTLCESIILLPGYKTKCDFDSTHTPPCFPAKRKCDSAVKNVLKSECKDLETSDSSRKQCAYSDSNKICKAEYISCDKIPSPSSENDCKNNFILTSNGDYDYSKICKFVDITGTTPAHCAPRDRTCDEYNHHGINDPSVCLSLKPTDPNKRCVYDYTNNICKEEYDSCESYSSNTLKKTRSGCESLILLEENEKCVYNIEEDKCVTNTTLTNTKCEEYLGKSQKICESIKPSAHSRCVLDKDSKCKERTFLCSEVFDEESCLYYAKPSNSNKRCAYDTNNRPVRSDGYKRDVCYEEYLRCEDYVGSTNNNNGCTGIQLFNGKKCRWDYELNRCYTVNKTCEEAGSKQECNLIAKSGVSNPDKKVCRYIYSNCIETYKYCSDFRGVDSTFCENYIEPFNMTEDKVDITVKCKYDDDRCHRVPKSCSEADGNPVLCSLISPNIKDNDTMYCAYIGNNCKRQFKKCEFWESGHSVSCADVIPENYLNKPCGTKVVDGKTICVKKDFCNVFSTDVNDFENICHSISYDCDYSSDGCTTTKEELSCEDIKFNKNSDENEEICKKAEASVAHKVCVLKEDLSGCEEIVNVTFYEQYYSNTTTDSAEFNRKGIQLVLLLVCLLF